MISEQKVLKRAQQFIDSGESVRFALVGRTGRPTTVGATGWGTAPGFAGTSVGTKAMVVATDRRLYWIDRWAFDWRRFLMPSFVRRKETRSSPLDRQVLEVSYQEGAGLYRGTDMFAIRAQTGSMFISLRPGPSAWQREAAKQIVSIVEASDAGSR